MNAHIKYTKNFYIIPALINIIILVNLFIWYVKPASQVLSKCIIGILISLIVIKLIDIKKNFLLVIFLAYALLLTLGLGTTEWDSRTIWLAHAKVIFLEQNLYAQIMDGGYIDGHVDYPIGFPALAATLANSVGLWNEVFPKAALIFFLMPPLFIIFDILENKILKIIFLVGLAIICRSYLFNGYMDAILALYTVAIVLIAMYKVSSTQLLESHPIKQTNISEITLASFFGVLLMLKNEGLAISILLTISLFLNSFPFTRLKIIMMVVAPLSFFLLIWKIPLLKYGITNDLISVGFLERVFQRVSDLNNIELISGYFFRYCDLISLVFILNLFRNDVRIRKFLLPISFVISYILLLIIIYLSTPNDLYWHLGTSVKRALLPILLVMFGTILFSFSPTYKMSLDKK